MLPELRFESYLSYCPKKYWPDPPSKNLIHAEEWMKAVKNGYVPRQGGSPYEVIARRLREDSESTDVAAVFRQIVRPVLVPVPRSSLPPKEPYHWPGRKLALALVKEGFGQRVVELLTRKESVEKASTGGKRNAHTQRDSLSVTERIPPAAPIVLVDDILTTGSQMMGAALALGAAMPGLEIACFAAMRTISDIADFQRLHAPVSGTIKLLEGGACRRRP